MRTKLPQQLSLICGAKLPALVVVLTFLVTGASSENEGGGLFGLFSSDKGQKEEQKDAVPADAESPEASADEARIEEIEDAEGKAPKSEETTAASASEATDRLLLEEIIEPEGEYHYAAFAKADPFASPYVDGMLLPAPSEPEAPADPNMQEDKVDEKTYSKEYEIPVVSKLQRYPIERLVVKGIWLLDNGERRAIILTPDKEGIIVKEDDPIANGKVFKIENEHIVARLYKVDPATKARTYLDHKMYLVLPRNLEGGKLILKKDGSVVRDIPSVNKNNVTIEDLPAQNGGVQNLHPQDIAEGMMRAGGGLRQQGAAQPNQGALVPNTPVPNAAVGARPNDQGLKAALPEAPPDERGDIRIDAGGLVMPK
jgi:hypothetical protein